MKRTAMTIAALVLLLNGTAYGATTKKQYHLGNDRITIIERAAKLTKSVSGLVTKDQGKLTLKTDKGVYQLKGVHLGGMVDRLVTVTGIVKDDKEDAVIYVVKAVIKS